MIFATTSHAYQANEMNDHKNEKTFLLVLLQKELRFFHFRAFLFFNLMGMGQPPL